MANAVILVDLDGTLLPLGAWEPVFRGAAAIIAEQAGASAQSVWEAVRRRNLQLMKALDWRAYDWQALFNAVARELGGKAPSILDILAKHLPAFRLIDGAVEMLLELKKLGRVEIATNGHAYYQMPVIKALGLDQIVDGVRTSDVYKCPKTCPEYFRNAQVMLGDNPVFDVYFPKRFGLAVVYYGDWEKAAAWYKKTLEINIDVMPDAVVKNLKDAPEAIRRLIEGKTQRRTI